jgi:hypothetical protein
VTISGIEPASVYMPSTQIILFIDRTCCTAVEIFISQNQSQHHNNIHKLTFYRECWGCLTILLVFWWFSRSGEDRRLWVNTLPFDYPSGPTRVIEVIVFELFQCIIMLLKKWSEPLLFDYCSEFHTCYFEILLFLVKGLSLNQRTGEDTAAIANCSPCTSICTCRYEL